MRKVCGAEACSSPLFPSCCLLHCPPPPPSPTQVLLHCCRVCPELCDAAVLARAPAILLQSREGSHATLALLTLAALVDGMQRRQPGQAPSPAQVRYTLENPKTLNS